jgi:uncharacterized cupin superfamily protein
MSCRRLPGAASLDALQLGQDLRPGDVLAVQLGGLLGHRLTNSD